MVQEKFCKKRSAIPTLEENIENIEENIEKIEENIENGARKDLLFPPLRKTLNPATHSSTLMSSAKSVFVGNIHAADKDGDGVVGVPIQERK